MDRKSRSHKRVAVLALAAAMMGGLVVTASPAHAETTLGGIDMQKACATQYRQGNVYTKFKQSDPFSWRCMSSAVAAPMDVLGGVDVNRACRDQYRNPRASAALNAKNAFGWYCRV